MSGSEQGFVVAASTTRAQNLPTHYLGCDVLSAAARDPLALTVGRLTIGSLQPASYTSTHTSQDDGICSLSEKGG